MNKLLKYAVGFVLLTNILTSFNVHAQRSEEEYAQRWAAVKQAIFNQAEIKPTDKLITLEAPKRAHDAAIVPIKINIDLDEGDALDQLYIVVDNNPAPLAGTFHFKTQKRQIEIQTRIRINEYTNVRAVAKTTSGDYWMNSSFVKAAGGCSAPMLSDQEAALARVGKMKFKIGESSEQLPQSSMGQVLISHPNNSGMQFDQISRNYIPAYFVHKVSVKVNDEELFVLDTNFSLSENPSIYFSFDPHDSANQVISVQATDSNNDVFEKSWTIEG